MLPAMLPADPRPRAPDASEAWPSPGEPDERSQHEGVTPLSETKHAINGWMRAKHLGGARSLTGGMSRGQ